MGQPDEEGSSMNLGERCDEIVRLIDETLAGVAGADADAVTAAADADAGPVATVMSLPVPRGPAGLRCPGSPDKGTRPGRAAAGF